MANPYNPTIEWGAIKIRKVHVILLLYFDIQSKNHIPLADADLKKMTRSAKVQLGAPMEKVVKYTTFRAK